MHAYHEIGLRRVYDVAAGAHIRLLETLPRFGEVDVFIPRHHHGKARFAQKMSQTERDAEVDIRLFLARIRAHHAAVRAAVPGIYDHGHAVGRRGMHRRGRACRGYYPRRGKHDRRDDDERALFYYERSHAVSLCPPRRSASS